MNKFNDPIEISANKSGKVRKVFLVLLLLIPSFCFAQLVTKTEEFWPEVKVYYKLNEKFRLYGLASGTRQETSYSEGAIGLYLDYFTYPFMKLLRPNHSENLPKRYLYLRAGYQYSMSTPEADNPFKESMIVTEANGKHDLPWDILLTVRNRFDWRFKSDGFFVRYRPRLEFEKDFRTEFLFFTPYVFVEYFANFGNSSNNKFRTEIGLDIKISRILTYSTYWNHQFENSPDISEVDAIGITLKFYLPKNKSNKQ